MVGRSGQQTSAGRVSLKLVAIGSVTFLAASALSGLGILVFGPDVDAPGAALTLYFVALGGVLLNSAGFLYGFAGLIQRQGSRFYAAVGTAVGLITLLFMLFFLVWPDIEFWYYCNHDYTSEVLGCQTRFP